MHGTTRPNKPGRRPLALAIAVAVAGLAAAGVFFSQSRSLEARLDDTAQELEETQTRLDNTSRELQQMQGELAQVRAALNTSQQRLTEASNQVQEVLGELDTAESQVAQMVPTDAPSGEMPIMFGFRKATVGSGYILWFQNKTTKTLPLKVTVTDAAGRRAKALRVVLEGATLSGTGFFAAVPKEIGPDESRTFGSGDRVEITCPGYGPMRKTLP
jgi:hypothetical protein